MVISRRGGDLNGDTLMAHQPLSRGRGVTAAQQVVALLVQVQVLTIPPWD